MTAITATALSDPTVLFAFIDRLPDPHIVCRADYRIVHANPAYLARFSDGRPLIGRTCFEVSHHYQNSCDHCGETCPLKESLRSGNPRRMIHLHHGCGGQEYVDIELTPILDASGRCLYFVERMSAPAAQATQQERLIGEAPAFRLLQARIARVAPSNASVLLLGESGTGKELTARAIHQASPRAGHAFVTVDCTGLPENLIESELFGHEKGAFTGASVRQIGLAEAANGGTLFLDEIGDLPLALQAKLLRLIETGTYRRLGSTEWRHTDVRIVSATHQALNQMVAGGRFRADLYYRLATFPLTLPPLRERREDIPLLANALLARTGTRHFFDTAALAYLTDYAFPGNIRELRNIIVRCCLLADDARLDVTLVQQALEEAQPLVPNAMPASTTPALAGLSRKAQARLLGISERTLYRRLRQPRH